MVMSNSDVHFNALNFTDHAMCYFNLQWILNSCMNDNVVDSIYVLSKSLGLITVSVYIV